MGYILGAVVTGPLWSRYIEYLPIHGHIQSWTRITLGTTLGDIAYTHVYIKHVCKPQSLPVEASGQAGSSSTSTCMRRLVPAMPRTCLSAVAPVPWKDEEEQEEEERCAVGCLRPLTAYIN